MSIIPRVYTGTTPVSPSQGPKYNLSSATHCGGSNNQELKTAVLVGMWGKKNPCTLVVRMCYLRTNTGNQFRSSLKLLKIKLPYDLAVAVMISLCPVDAKSAYCRAICISVFNTALHTTAKLWGQPRYPGTHVWIKKMWHTSITGLLIGS